MYLAELIAPAGAEAQVQVQVQFSQSIGQREATDFISTRRRKDGALFEVSVSSSPISAGDGHIVGVFDTVRDTSAHGAANRSINELTSMLDIEMRTRTSQGESGTILQRAILAHASYAIIATDQDGIIQLFNPAAERMLGYAAAEVLGKHSPGMLHDSGEMIVRAAALSQELSMTIVPGFDVFTVKPTLGMSEENECTYIRKDGSRFLVQLHVQILRRPVRPAWQRLELRGLARAYPSRRCRRRFRQVDGNDRWHRSIRSGISGLP